MDPEERKIYLKILIFSGALLLLIVGFIISFFRQQKKLNQEKIKAEINTTEQIKKKFASNLHDDLGPILASIRIYVNALSQQNPSDLKLVASINSYIDLAINQAKAIANDLMPNTLQRKKLSIALAEYVENIRTYVSFEIELKCDTFDADLNDEAKLNLYRIVQEIFTNTIKYANARLLKIHLEQKEHYLNLMTSDNGKGFTYTAHNFIPSGYGISNIKSRVEIMEGACTIFSKPGEGTRYQISIPLKKICR